MREIIAIAINLTGWHCFSHGLFAELCRCSLHTQRRGLHCPSIRVYLSSLKFKRTLTCITHTRAITSTPLSFRSLLLLSLVSPMQDDVMKVDFGCQIGGRIVDCAWTVAFNPVCAFYAFSETFFLILLLSLPSNQIRSFAASSQGRDKHRPPGSRQVGDAKAGEERRGVISRSSKALTQDSAMWALPFVRLIAIAMISHSTLTQLPFLSIRQWRRMK